MSGKNYKIKDKKKDFPGPGSYNRFSEFGILAPKGYKKPKRVQSAKQMFHSFKKNSGQEIVERNAKRMFDRNYYWNKYIGKYKIIYLMFINRILIYNRKYI